MSKILKRPGLGFISSLPTISVQESTYKNLVLWKVELPKPVVIMYADYPVLNTFWVEIITESRWDNGWKREMHIGIKKTKSARGFIIGPREEDFYSKVKWWDWYRSSM